LNGDQYNILIALLVVFFQSPADRLAASCSRCQETDLDTVICSLGTEKKFVVDAQTQQSMQPLIQWVADLALYLVTAAPVMQQSAVPFAGVTLLRSAGVLTTIRELLVMVRMWGMINTSCLPTFTVTTAGVDILAHLFSLITRMWMACLEAPGRDFDDSLIDECCTLSGQVSGLFFTNFSQDSAMKRDLSQWLSNTSRETSSVGTSRCK
jgi:mediator of RNA polymerase II transcription subunit 16